MTETENDEDTIDLSKSIHGCKVTFTDLVMVPKRERNVMRRKKTFQTHLLSSKENQEIIQKAEEISKKKRNKYKSKDRNK